MLMTVNVDNHLFRVYSLLQIQFNIASDLRYDRFWRRWIDKQVKVSALEDMQGLVQS